MSSPPSLALSYLSLAVSHTLKHALFRFSPAGTTTLDTSGQSTMSLLFIFPVIATVSPSDER